VDGVLGVSDPMAECASSSDVDAVAMSAEFEPAATRLIGEAVAVLPTVLARMIAQYARGYGRTRLFAGSVGVAGATDGTALSGATFQMPTALARLTRWPVLSC
jgi:hypothetical protein